MIITGGGSRGQDAIATKTVDRYNKKVPYPNTGVPIKIPIYFPQGFVEDLPDMMTARTSHGCGFFYQQGKKVNAISATCIL